MKVCPACNKTYDDDEINYCLADGSTLLKKRGAKSVDRSSWNDVVALILVALAALVFLCLVSGSPTDRTWLGNSSSSEPIRNLIGVAGATIAAVLFNAIGWTAYLVPVLILLVALRVYQSDDLVPSPTRFIGYILFAISLAGLISLFGGEGAILGEAAAQGTAYVIGRIGAGILLTAVLASSVLLITNFTIESFIAFCRGIWEGSRPAVALAERRQRLRDESLAKSTDAQKRAEKRKGKREKSLAGEKPEIHIADPAVPLFEHEKIEPEPVAPEPEIVPEPPSVETYVEPEPVPETVLIEEPEEIFEFEQPHLYDGEYVLPSSRFLTDPPPSVRHSDKELVETAQLIVDKTTEFKVPGKIMHKSPGPVVTTFEFKPEAGVKYSRVTSLVDDLSLALKAESIRIDRIPGKAYVGIEVPNRKRETIFLREVIESDEFKKSESLLTLGLGKTIDGTKYVADLAKMPHLLIAGATGAGKSVGVNTLVMSILYKAKPDEVKFIMVDPKRLELGLYAGIPHLMHEIIVEPKKAANALRRMVVEMERRYKDLAGYGVRNIDGYNIEAKRRNELEQWDDNGEPHKKLPYIVIIIDELADLMMVSGKEVEDSITRLAQMARAVGIHLVLATQRPSVDVITGLIKANFPSRISFRVSSKVDSRTIIDANGAESLLGQGDMLFLPPGQSSVTRVHGAYVNEKEIKAVVDFIKEQGLSPDYDVTITKSDEELTDDAMDSPGRRDPLFYDALKCVVNAKRGSTSLLQRHLSIGYGRAAKILDAMVREGMIGEMDGSTRARPVLQKALDELQDVAEGALGNER